MSSLRYNTLDQYKKENTEESSIDDLYSFINKKERKEMKLYYNDKPLSVSGPILID